MCMLQLQKPDTCTYMLLKRSYKMFISAHCVLTVHCTLPSQSHTAHKSHVRPSCSIVFQRINEKPQVVNEYESGKAIPNQQIISKLERAVGVKLRGKDIGAPLGARKK